MCSDGETRLAHQPLPRGVQVQHALLFLAASKTDPFRHGTQALIAAPLALDALRTWLTMHPRRSQPTAPLFCFAHGAPLSRSDLIDCMRNCIAALGLAAHEYAGHSFRRGGATSLAVAGTPEHLIQALGRWSSDCYRLYIEMPEHSIAAAARRM